MRSGVASHTAQHNALFRALERRLPRPLFDDPWARRFLRGRYRLLALLPAGPLTRAIDRRWPGPRGAVVVRTRYIDDAVVRAAAQGLDQLVVLGAGLDSRPYRLHDLESVRVYEVDHPSTQALKLQAMGRRPPHVTYVPMDLRADDLASALVGAGFVAGRRTLFLWEGVTNYLDEASVDATVRLVSRAGSALLFTYVDRAVLEGPGRFEGGRESVEYVRRLQEPFTFGFHPPALAGFLRERGLVLEDDRSLDVVAKQYYGSNPPKVSSYYHLASARCLG